MSKRTSAAPSTPRKKRKQGSDSQPSLHSFIGSPTARNARGTIVGGPLSGPMKNSGNRQSEGLGSGTSAGSTPGTGSTQPTERNGPFLNSLYRQEAHKPAINLSVQPREIIDVDLLDDDLASSSQPEPSTPRPLEVKESSSSPTQESPVHDVELPPGNDPPWYSALDADPITYTLSSSPWNAGSSTPYSFLAHAFTTLSQTRSRIAILNVLTNALRAIIRFNPSSLCATLYLLSGTLSPPYLPLELGLGPSTISKVIQNVSGLTPMALKRLYNATGDPGDVAFEAKSNVRTLFPHPPLLLNNVYDTLLRISRVKGAKTAKQKQSLMEKLLVAAKGEETRYLVRTFCQNLRVGAVRTSILVALARAMVLTPPTNLTSATPPDSQLYVSQQLLSQIQPLPVGTKKKVEDKARENLNEMFSRAEGIIKQAYARHPNYDDIAAALLSTGLADLCERVPLTVGIPLLPTLGSPTRSLDEIYDRIGDLPFIAEFKYDGQRAQIHASRDIGSRDIVRVFSRHLEDMTDKYPDIVSLVESIFANSSEITSFIIDAEVVAIDPEDGSLKTFQELSNRPRRDVKLDDVKVSVCVFVFDIMYLNGEVLIGKSLRERKSLLRSHFPPVIPEYKGAARLDHVQSCTSDSGRESIEQLWQEAVNGRSEGLMIKILDNGMVRESTEKARKKPLPATYEPDKRTLAWLKLKKDYVLDLGDSLDLVPIGAWHGNGRKAQWWSPILLALWDPAAGKLVAVCKCMSGFSDVFYKELQERYPENSEVCSRVPLWEGECDIGGLKPEVFFKPSEVWEIRGADVTISPVSVAAQGLVSDTRGLSLRFPRFIRRREDKGIEDASTPEFLANMYKTQQGRSIDRGGVDDGELVDVDVEESEVEEEFDEDL